MPKLKALLFASIVGWFLIGCNNADINYNGRQLSMQVDNTAITFNGRLLTQKNINFRTLFLSQKAIQTNEGNIIVYENAKTDINYEFQFTLMRVTQIVFDAARIRLLYTTPKMQIFQLQLVNGRILNVIAQQSESQQIKYMYGMSAKQLDRILKQLQANVRYTPYRNVLKIRNTFNAIQSRWTDWKVHFVPLVVPYQTFRYY
ncbi:hypothetical protein [Sulfurovum riftiae]|uniref:Uncharacterized protein n=1 Tax=Sulfurovum riftiae TaxID=1630136 RepID=A0A151CEW9_9BACT|nr:hypothetical protein [Sulfurovum riftiae]KYJ86014.1 hypothetical protein AS592_05360 [Sulfurovum riftiae]